MATTQQELALIGKYAYSFPSIGKVEIIKNPMILIENNEIVAIGKKKEVEKELAGHDIIGDPKKDILLPGFVNTHTHAAMTLFRGIADDLELMDWLNNYIWPMEKRLEPKHIKAGALLAALEFIRGGVTTANSMYWYPEQEAEAFVKIGLRGFVGLTALELGDMGNYKRDYDFISKWHTSNNDLIRTSLQPHATYTVSKELYQDIYAFKQELNNKYPEAPIIFHTHIAETREEWNNTKKFVEKMGFSIPSEVKSVVQYLDLIGVLDEDTVGAHVVHTNCRDLEILKQRKVGVSINIMSNLKLASGIPPVPRYLEHGVKLSIGTDGASSNNTLNLFDSVRTIALLYKGLNYDPLTTKISEVLYMATKGGASVLRLNKVGELKIGYKADIISLSLDTPETMPVYNANTALSHIVYVADRTMVKNVVINGELVLEDRHAVKTNDEKIMEQFNNAAIDLYEKTENK